MSYCRFSSDNFQCDVYVLDDVVGGLTVHVAGMRRIFKEPLPAPVKFDRDHAEAWVNYHHAVSRIVEETDLVPIGLVHAGGTFHFLTVRQCADWLRHLRELGYRVPEYAIQALWDEAAVA